jgi:hypothetical protein
MHGEVRVPNNNMASNWTSKYLSKTRGIPKMWGHPNGDSEREGEKGKKYAEVSNPIKMDQCFIRMLCFSSRWPGNTPNFRQKASSRMNIITLSLIMIIFSTLGISGVVGWYIRGSGLVFLGW